MTQVFTTVHIQRLFFFKNWNAKFQIFRRLRGHIDFLGVNFQLKMANVHPNLTQFTPKKSRIFWITQPMTLFFYEILQVQDYIAIDYSHIVLIIADLNGLSHSRHQNLPSSSTKISETNLVVGSILAQQILVDGPTRSDRQIVNTIRE